MYSTGLMINDRLICNGFRIVSSVIALIRIKYFIFGNDEQILLISRLDNLGKGSSGAAVQNMNIMLRLEEGTGLS
ncbi:MAG: hypothetical protein WCD89_11155 [Anaerocolumna sp.]